MKILLMLLLLLQPCSPSRALAEDMKPVDVKKTDKCPVCGMFVARYPDFIAQVIFEDGSYAVFDGAKDMFKYIFNLSRYNPGKNSLDIAAIYVTDYYSLDPIDGWKAGYVTGSDVYGPMGHELIPFAKDEDAREFMVDHAGKSLLKFESITQEVVRSLD